MNEYEYLAKIICEQLDLNRPVVLASIVKQQGSAPRHNGTQMMIDADGKGYGTIGGSLLEATTIKEAGTAVRQGQSKLMDFDLTGNGVYGKGMICGGKATVLLDFIPASQENRDFSRLWQDTLSTSSVFYLLTQLEETGNTVSITGHGLLFADGHMAGNLNLQPMDIQNLTGELRNISSTTLFPIGDSQVIVQPMATPKTLYCFGAGHVALPTAHIAAMVGFRVVVLDDRAEFANAERFPEAAEVRVIKDFNRALEEFEIDRDSFIVIVTRGHQFDREVLQQSLKTNAGYIGMISSRRKRDAIYEALMSEGVTKQELERVHSPIGIAIGGETPEEIAVSIVAELISVRVKMQA